MQRQEQALRAILRYPPEFLVDLLGSDQFMEGTSLVFEGLQSQALNKQASVLVLPYLRATFVCAYVLSFANLGSGIVAWFWRFHFLNQNQ